MSTATRPNPVAPKRGLRSTSSRANGSSNLVGGRSCATAHPADCIPAGCASLLPAYHQPCAMGCTADRLCLARIGLVTPRATLLLGGGMFAALAALGVRAACMRRLAGFGIVARRIAIVAAGLAHCRRRAIRAQVPRRLETLDRLDREVLLQQAADVAQQAFLFAADQRQRQAFGAGATGTADAVHVI